LPISITQGYHAALAPNAASDTLQGSWSAACSGANPSTKAQLIFLGRQLSVVRNQYDDSTCGRLMFTLTVGKTFTLPDDPALAAQTLATTVRLARVSVAAGYVDAANAASLCGQSSGWQSSTSVDASGLSCLGVSVPAYLTTANETVTFSGSSSSSTSLTYNSVTYTKDL
jgi:hypothetical protein